MKDNRPKDEPEEMEITGPLAPMIGYLLDQDSRPDGKKPKVGILIAIEADGRVVRILFGPHPEVSLALDVTKQLVLDDILKKFREKTPGDPGKFFNFPQGKN